MVDTDEVCDEAYVQEEEQEGEGFGVEHLRGDEFPVQCLNVSQGIAGEKGSTLNQVNFLSSS
jgi:hypothetical protein